MNYPQLERIFIFTMGLLIGLTAVNLAYMQKVDALKKEVIEAKEETASIQTTQLRTLSHLRACLEKDPTGYLRSPDLSDIKGEPSKL